LKLTKIIGTLLVMGLVSITTPAGVFAESGQIAWVGYQDGMEQIKNGSRKGFLHFYTTWCAYCKIMNEKTFTDAGVIRYLNENFVPIYIDAEVDKAVARTYGADKFPFSIFLDETGAAIGNRPGYIPPDVLLDMLTYVHTDAYKTVTFSAFLENKNEDRSSEPSTLE
jgi:thioredoxin 1